MYYYWKLRCKITKISGNSKISAKFCIKKEAKWAARTRLSTSLRITDGTGAWEAGEARALRWRLLGDGGDFFEKKIGKI